MMLGAELMVVSFKNLLFPYEWFDSFDKLNHIGPVKYEEFYSSLKGGITISQENTRISVMNSTKEGASQ